MTRLFRSKSCGLVGVSDFNAAPPTPFFHNYKNDDEEEEEEKEKEDTEEEDKGDRNADDMSKNPISTPFISPDPKFGAGKARRNSGSGHNPFLDVLVAALRKSLVTCSVEPEDVSSMDIGWPTEVRHVSHVTFDRFNGFLGLPTELEPEVPRKVPSARFGFFNSSLLRY